MKIFKATCFYNGPATNELVSKNFIILAQDKKEAKKLISSNSRPSDIISIGMIEVLNLNEKSELEKSSILHTNTTFH